MEETTIEINGDRKEHLLFQNHMSFTDEDRREFMETYNAALP